MRGSLRYVELGFLAYYTEGDSEARAAGTSTSDLERRCAGYAAMCSVPADASRSASYHVANLGLGWVVPLLLLRSCVVHVAGQSVEWVTVPGKARSRPPSWESLGLPSAATQQVRIIGDRERAPGNDDFPTTLAIMKLTNPKMLDGENGKPPVSAEVRALTPHALLTRRDHFNCGGKWAVRTAAECSVLPAARHIVVARWGGARHARCSLPTQRSPPCAHGE